MRTNSYNNRVVSSLKRLDTSDRESLVLRCVALSFSRCRLYSMAGFHGHRPRSKLSVVHSMRENSVKMRMRMSSGRYGIVAFELKKKDSCILWRLCSTERTTVMVVTSHNVAAGNFQSKPYRDRFSSSNFKF